MSCQMLKEQINEYLFYIWILFFLNYDLALFFWLFNNSKENDLLFKIFVFFVNQYFLFMFTIKNQINKNLFIYFKWNSFIKDFF